MSHCDGAAMGWKLVDSAEVVSCVPGWRGRSLLDRLFVFVLFRRHLLPLGTFSWRYRAFLVTSCAKRRFFH